MRKIEYDEMIKHGINRIRDNILDCPFRKFSKGLNREEKSSVYLKTS